MFCKSKGSKFAVILLLISTVLIIACKLLNIPEKSIIVFETNHLAFPCFLSPILFYSSYDEHHKTHFCFTKEQGSTLQPLQYVHKCDQHTAVLALTTETPVAVAKMFTRLYSNNISRQEMWQIFPLISSPEEHMSKLTSSNSFLLYCKWMILLLPRESWSYPGQPPLHQWPLGFSGTCQLQLYQVAKFEAGQKKKLATARPRERNVSINIFRSLHDKTPDHLPRASSSSRQLARWVL